MKTEEEKFAKEFEKRSVMKKKFLGIPMFVFVMLGIGMVLATAAIIYVAYNHSFTKTLNVFNTGGGSSDYVSISGSGDITSSVINCDSTTTGTCLESSGTITLTNSDTSPHDCTVITTGNSNVAVSYDKVVAPITVPASGSVDFTISYQASITGAYPMQTTISCP
jgi:hypothetical protein